MPKKKKGPWARLLRFAASKSERALRKHPGICALLWQALNREVISNIEMRACARYIAESVRIYQYKYVCPSGMVPHTAYLDEPGDWSARILYLCLLAHLEMTHD